MNIKAQVIAFMFLNCLKAMIGSKMMLTHPIIGYRIWSNSL